MDLDTTNVIAIQMPPVKMSWAAGKYSSNGETLNELVHFIRINKLEAATLSLSFLLPVELGQAAPIKQKE